MNSSCEDDSRGGLMDRPLNSAITMRMCRSDSSSVIVRSADLLTRKRGALACDRGQLELCSKGRSSYWPKRSVVWLRRVPAANINVIGPFFPVLGPSNQR